jgi:aspartyl-tRNA(Asn)/glutamyl-tRNA(Gln) amidotransferase subunit C
MASREDVQKLAALARIRVSDSELDTFVKEFDAILAYVGQLEKLSIDTKGGNVVPPLRNVFREDGEPHAKGEWTQKLAAQFPERKGDALSVKQIISHD